MGLDCGDRQPGERSLTWTVAGMFRSMDFDGGTWTCTSCHVMQTLEWDDDLEQEVGLPASSGQTEDGDEYAVCDGCAAGRDPEDLREAFAG